MGWDEMACTVIDGWVAREDEEMDGIDLSRSIGLCARW